MINWVKQLSRSVGENEKVVLVTVISTKGSTPREAGTKMIVSTSRIEGTIGGGNLEYQCIDIARQRLLTDSGKSWKRYTHRFPLGASLGQCCGGLANVLFETIESTDAGWIQELETHSDQNANTVLITPLDKDHSEKRLFSKNYLSTNEALKSEFAQKRNLIVRKLLNQEHSAEPATTTVFTSGEQQESYLAELIVPNDFHIMLFGAGHVGKALVNVLSGLDCTISWVDNREEQFPDRIPNNTIKRLEEDPEDALDTVPKNTYFIVMTHCHQLDERICTHILRRNDFGYCGLIGSESKRRKFEKRLLAKGISLNALNHLTCPIGISGISGKKPGEIAIAISAQILQLRDKTTKMADTEKGSAHEFKLLVSTN